MKNYEKEAIQSQLKSEKQALDDLKRAYEEAKKEVEENIAYLNSRQDMQNLSSIVYQKQYQEAILKQLDSALDDLNKNQYSTMDEYFNSSYETGYVASMYSLQKQTGVTFLMPLNRDKMKRAIYTDAKVSKSYYQNREYPENIANLKRNIQRELSRGIASEKSWIQIAHDVAMGMNSPFKKAMSDAMRIIRTEGHRINQSAYLDACYDAKEHGANVVKQWDATLDGLTRPWHREADGQIRELDEKFIVDGEEMEAPSIGGSARNVCNCRCQLLQRSRWALNDNELNTLRQRSDFFMNKFGDAPKDFTDFKKKYLNASDALAVASALIKFKKASTIKEAESFVMNQCGIPRCSYKGVPIEIANAMNESLVNALNYSPDIRIRMNWYGSGQERNKLFKAELENYYYERFTNDYQYDDVQAKKYAKKYASKMVGHIGQYTMAFASSGESYNAPPELEQIIRSYSGISVNTNFMKNASKTEQSIKHDADVKWHPEGCTTIKSVFDHEFGHQLDYAYNLKNETEIASMFAKSSKEEITENLSEYGARNVREFIAEAYSEYLNNPNPRPIAKTIGEIIEKKVNQ